MDGLAAVPPYGDPYYKRQRGELALARPGETGGALDLDGFFGLHPALQHCHALYRSAELAPLHAVASPYRERSHFDGQDVLENGTASPSGARDGWLNRMLTRPEEAIGLGQTVPLVLRGVQRVPSWAPSRLPDTDAATLERIAWLYDQDEFFASRFQQALAIDAVTDMGPMQGDVRGGRGLLTALAKAAGRFLAEPDGPRLAVLEYAGWDTHANQGALTGPLATRLGFVDEGLKLLQTSLGSSWRDTVVLAVTEFGRTAAINGTRGTDHGTGACALLAGGAVNGGRVIADWPGLASRDLFEGRDLRPTVDLRAVFKGVLGDHLGLSRSALDTAVFPGSAEVPPVRDLNGDILVFCTNTLKQNVPIVLRAIRILAADAF
jgi:uncharacterized protein (DUF1501 family)